MTRRNFFTRTTCRNFVLAPMSFAIFGAVLPSNSSSGSQRTQPLPPSPPTPTAIAAATITTLEAPSNAAPSYTPPACAATDCNCSDFASQDDANRFLSWSQQTTGLEDKHGLEVRPKTGY